jgi:hypothetical protein
VTETELFESPDLIPSDFCLWGWMNTEVSKWSWIQLLVSILDAAARIQKREGQLRRTTRAVLTRTAKCIEVDIGIFEHLLRNVTNFCLSVWQICNLNINLKLS